MFEPWGREFDRAEDSWTYEHEQPVISTSEDAQLITLPGAESSCSEYVSANGDYSIDGSYEEDYESLRIRSQDFFLLGHSFSVVLNAQLKNSGTDSGYVEASNILFGFQFQYTDSSESDRFAISLPLWSTRLSQWSAKKEGKTTAYMPYNQILKTDKTKMGSGIIKSIRVNLDFTIASNNFSSEVNYCGMEASSSNNNLILCISKDLIFGF